MKVRATDVHKAYGDVTALDGLSLSIPSGSTFGVLGTNGAGKSTLFRLLVGHDRPDAGTIAVGGTDVTAASRRIRERVGYLPEHVGFPTSLTGREVLSFHATVRGLPDDGRIARAIDRVGLEPAAADRAVGGYSNGMQRRLGLASVLLAEPAVLILDEPTAGLDPRGVDEFHRIIERINDETDATVVFCSHALAEVERLCDRVAILHEGEVRASGPVSEVVAAIDAGDRTDRSDLRAAFCDVVEGVDGESGRAAETAEVSP
ncbi:ATP-binding cassette domain-containing protein [Halorubrum sp. CBA1125]|uniref:ABC transporter ATP-binding protein n=1 Tax=Halorubrum sp. CBA1125 TaxID=2668072 RepID=UPI0012E7C2DA|nr:ABC transporter ATP-binding protein [Halorubrum sp. CBA1125]MUW15975.1 ATP-binding cassette domain-containing protein [Halorubrum sp. CBA1125]